MAWFRQNIVARVVLVVVLAIAATLAIAEIVTHITGEALRGTGLLLSILCPLLIAAPASAYQFWQSDRLRHAKAALAEAQCRLETIYRELEQAYATLREQSRHDGLTGALNREAFIEALKQGLEAGQGTLFILDADHFKVVNDRHGHQAGDSALRALVSAVTAKIGAEDIVGRIGGEEFAVFMPGVVGDAAFAAGERIRQAVWSMQVTAPSGARVPISVSLGGSDSRDATDLESLWRLADQRLYAAKATGRNRLIMTDPTVAVHSTPAA